MHFKKKTELEPTIIWKVATCQRIPSKKDSNSVGRYLSQRYGLEIHYFDNCQLIKTCMCNIRLQAPKLAGKSEIKHWCACGVDDGRSGGRCTVTSLPIFLGWIDFLSYGALNWASDQIKYQCKTLNTTWPQARDTLRWWWSAYTLVWPLSINLH